MYRLSSDVERSKAATTEEALCFGGTDGVDVPVHAVHSKDNEVEQLGYMTEQKFESFEQQLKELNAGKTTNSHDSVKRVCRNISIGAVSWKRSEVGERILMNVSFAGKMVIGKGECPLNFSESALTVDWGWHIRKKQSLKPHNKVGKVPSVACVTYTIVAYCG